MRLAISLELQPESGHLLAARLMVVFSLYVMQNLFLVARRFQATVRWSWFSQVLKRSGEKSWPDRYQP